MEDWQLIENAPRDGRNLLVYNNRPLNGLAKDHPMRFWTSNLLMTGNYWHPKMIAMNLDHDIVNEITEDMKPTHYMEIPKFTIDATRLLG